MTQQTNKFVADAASIRTDVGDIRTDAGSVGHGSAKPPFIETQTFRLLLETERPERFLRPEYFRTGRGASPAMGQQNLGDWITVDRHDVVQNCVTNEDGTAYNLSRMVVTTDAGVGKTTEMHWLEAMLNHPAGDTAAFFLTFSQLPARVDDLLDEVLLPRLLQARTDEGAAAIDRDEGLRVLEHLRSEGRLVLLLDALDQAPADGSAVELLAQLLKDPRWRRCRLIVSGRPHALQRHWAGLFAAEHGIGWRFIQVDEFDATQQRIFLGQDADGRDRFELIPPEAREILATPRVLEYLRGLPDSDLKRIKTAGDVYWLSVQHLLVEGMRGSNSARQIGLAAQEMTPANVQARSLARAMQLLGAIAFEMTSTPVLIREPESDQERSVPNFDGVRRGKFGAFRKRLLERLASPADAPLLTRDLDSLAALNDFVSQSFFDTVEGLQEIFWRNRTLQEFFTAYWLAQHSSEQDASGLWDGSEGSKSGKAKSVGGRTSSAGAIWTPFFNASTRQTKHRQKYSSRSMPFCLPAGPRSMPATVLVRCMGLLPVGILGRAELPPAARIRMGVRCESGHSLGTKLLVGRRV